MVYIITAELSHGSVRQDNSSLIIAAHLPELLSIIANGSYRFVWISKEKKKESTVM